MKIPFDQASARPTVTIEIGETGARTAIFDTGASGNVLDTAYAAAAGLPNERPVRVGSGACGPPLEGYLTTIPQLRVGGVVLERVPAAVLDVPKPPEHQDAVGVLSPNIFAGRFVALDFAEGALILTDKEGFAPAGEEAPYSDGPRPLPAIPVTIGGTLYHAHLDTGAPRALTLPLALAEKLVLEAPPVEAGVARVVTRERKLYKARIKGAVRVGPLVLVDPEVEFLEGLPTVNVGMALLRRLTVTLDPEEKKLWVAAAG